MKYISTRGDATPRAFCDILLEGLAPDGGLYLPSAYPQIDRATVHGVAFDGDEVLPAELVLSGEPRVTAGAARNRAAHLPAGRREGVAVDAAEDPSTPLVGPHDATRDEPRPVVEPDDFAAEPAAEAGAGRDHHGAGELHRDRRPAGIGRQNLALTGG